MRPHPARTVWFFLDPISVRSDLKSVRLKPSLKRFGFFLVVDEFLLYATFHNNERSNMSCVVIGLEQKHHHSEE